MVPSRRRRGERLSPTTLRRIRVPPNDRQRARHGEPLRHCQGQPNNRRALVHP